MIIAESRQVRRLIGRLDKGTELMAAFVELSRGHAIRTGELRAIGSLDQVELREFDQITKDHRPSRKLEGAFEIVSLLGNFSESEGKPSLHAHVLITREHKGATEVHGGHLVSARVFALEFVIDAADDLVLRRTLDPKTGLPLWNEAIGLDFANTEAPTTGEFAPEESKTQPPFERGGRSASEMPSATSPSWQDVQRASSPAADEVIEQGTDVTPLEVGDFVEHPKFGRCKVERIEGDHEFISARLQSGRLIRLSLEVITLIFQENDGDRRVFRALLGRSG